ncbi:hypothetical protein KGF57_003064 [Candida theae]|uniref:Uncharacterized protein n=1 Tax=Candida theae TaxID=1198502 RepID=A0AAD5BE32_9ASCO|nr:uncharacterized protein KGF57_003064 [Candida theae]KAI5957797.1 hypothetical protein KGF57_003064 [Candida theae]
MQRWLRQYRAIVLNTYIPRDPLCSRSYSTKTAFFNKNPTQSLPEKLSTYISNLLTEQHDKMLDQPVQKLIDTVPNLARDLKKSIDIENKLYTVLSYDPVLIDPRLYLHFYDPTVGASVKRLMLERLLYHQQYAACWKLFTGDTLNDLDAFLSTTKAFITKQRNDFAVIDFIISMPEFGENDAYQLSVLDALSHAFNVNARRVLQTHHDINDLRQLSDLQTYPKHDFISTVLWLKQMMKRLYYEGTTSQQVQEVLVQSSDIMMRPGWISSIFPKFESWSSLAFPKTPKSILPYMDSMNEMLSSGVRLSDLDTLYMLHSNVTPFSIFSVYKLSHMNKSILNYLMKCLVDKSNHEELKAAYLVSRKQLDVPVVIMCVNKLLANEAYVLPLIKQLEKSKREKVILNLDYLGASQYMELIVHFNNNQKIARHLVTKFANSAHSHVENLTLLAASNINSKRTLLEIFRSTILRAGVVDQKFISVILNAIVDKAIPNKGGFKNSLDALDQKGKTLMHNTFRSLGQSLSLLGETDLALAFDAIYNTIHHGSFCYKGDKIAQKYIYKSLSDEAIRFIIREDNRVQKLQKIMGKMTTSTFWVKYWLIHAMVLDDFSNAIKLLEFYQRSKRDLTQFFPAIVFGVIKSQKMDLNEKVKYLDCFLTRAKKLKYENVLKFKAGVELVRHFQRAASNDSLSKESVKWLAALSGKNRHIRGAFHFNRIKKHSVVMK